jgi:hypothetical protein
MAMLIDLILKPYANVHGPLFLWMDNCGSHKTGPLPPIFTEANVKTGFLPPNTTYILQVLDLVVNGPLKAHIRGLRAERMLEYFQIFKQLFISEASKPPAERSLPVWKPPKPTMTQCILDVMNLISSKFATPKFKNSLKKSFISTGAAPDSNGNFVIYKETTGHGTMEKAPAGTIENFLDNTNVSINEIQLATILADQMDNEDAEEEDQVDDEEE